MAFPETILPIAVQLKYDGVWNDITPDVNTRGLITATQGKANQQSSVEPSRCDFELNNGTSKVPGATSVIGRYSVDNPNSDVFGKIGRNTEARVLVGDTDTRIALPGIDGSYVSVPDNATLDNIVDIDIRIEITPDTWRPDEDMILASRWGDSQDSWMFLLTTLGQLKLFWYTGSVTLSETSAATVDEDTTRLALRVSMDADDGGGSRQLTYYTASSIDSSWSTFDTDSGGATSIAATDNPLTLGSVENGSFSLVGTRVFAGEIHDFELRGGVGATTLIGDPDISDQDSDATSWTGGDGFTWSLNGRSYLWDPAVRAFGDVSEWPTEWDKSGNDVWSTVTVAGVLRRLTQRSSPLHSAMRRGVLADDRPTPVAYWPFEDGEDAKLAESVFPNHQPAIPVQNTKIGEEGRSYTFAAYSDLDSSKPMPVHHSAWGVCRIPGYGNPGTIRLFTVCIPQQSHEALVDLELFWLFTSSDTVSLWALGLDASDQITIYGFDPDQSSVLTNTLTSLPSIVGAGALVTLLLETNGSDLDWTVGVCPLGETSFTTSSGTLTNHEVGAARRVRAGSQLAPVQDGTTDAMDYTCAHVFAQDETTIGDNLIAAYNAHVGETAGDRFARLATEHGLPFILIGNAADTEHLGPQLPGAYFTLLTNLAKTDLGILSDMRALTYRTRASIYNQDAALVLDYAASELAEIPRPVFDDDATANKVTVARPSGGAHTAERTSGALSTQAPPNGIGEYESSPSAKVQFDGQLPDQSGWRLHLGTLNEPRFPSIEINLARNPELEDTVKQLRLGDRIQVQNPPEWVSPNTLDLIVQGWTEQLWQYEWTFRLVCTPASAYTVGVRGSAVRGTAGSELDADITDSATSMDVLTTAGPVWTTDAGDLPLDITVGGEVMRVTAIGAATAKVQTFTVTRSINGITKSHDAGDAVRLLTPGRRAL